MPVLNRIAGFAEDMAEWRRWLHRNPELGFDLPKTAAYVAERLRDIGVDSIETGIAQSGIVATIDGSGPGPTIGLRADMDALPIRERSDAPWVSETPGNMHACGHDGHMAMLLGAARYLAETRNFSGRVALIFQPAEEEGGGGRVMAEEGIMERYDISRVFALHTAPSLPEGAVGTRPGAIWAASDEYFVTIDGAGGHAAYPHETRDPIPPLLACAQAFDTIAAHNLKPIDSLVVAVTRIQAGTSTNIVPSTASLAGTVRTYDPAVQALAERRMTEICAGIGQSFGVGVTLDYSRGYPATVNHPDETTFAAKVAAEIVGDGNVDVDVEPTMGSEDFSYMLEVRPGAYLFLGQETPYPLHHESFDFNDAVAPIGASFFARLVETAQPARQGGP